MAERIFTDIHHIALVVRDAEKTAAYWESLGLGPWQDYPPMTQYTQITGVEPETFHDLRFKMLDLGKIHVRLCQPGKGDSPQKRFLEEKGEGVFHISFTVPDSDRADDAAASLGAGAAVTGRRADGKGFSFYDTQKMAGGVVLAQRST